MEAFKKSFKKISDEFLSKYDLAGKWYSERKAWIKDKLISVVSEIAETTKGYQWSVMDFRHCSPYG